jgi:small subunit ribosomal protein S20
MANHKSAEKRNRQRIKRTTRGRAVKTRVRRVVRQAQLALESGSKDAAELVALASKLLDRAAAKHVVPEERASRLKSRLALHLNKVSAKS